MLKGMNSGRGYRYKKLQIPTYGGLDGKKDSLQIIMRELYEEEGMVPVGGFTSSQGSRDFANVLFYLEKPPSTEGRSLGLSSYTLDIEIIKQKDIAEEESLNQVINKLC